MIEALMALKNKMIEIEVKNSYGIAILKNGRKVEISCLFRWFMNLWIIASRGDFDEEAQRLFSDGTVFSNGVVALDITDISAMIDVSAEHDMEERREKEKNGTEKEYVDVDSAIFQLTKNSEEDDDEED